MKKLVLISAIVVLTAALSLGTVSAQRGGWYCPWMGGTPGSQTPQSGWYCPWMGSQTGPAVAKPGQPLTADQAKAMVEQHISGNPNLKAGKVAEKNGAYEVDIVTKKEGSLVDKIQVNKQTGWFRSVY